MQKAKVERKIEAVVVDRVRREPTLDPQMMQEQLEALAKRSHAGRLFGRHGADVSANGGPCNPWGNGSVDEVSLVGDERALVGDKSPLVDDKSPIIVDEVLASADRGGLARGVQLNVDQEVPRETTPEARCRG